MELGVWIACATYLWSPSQHDYSYDRSSDHNPKKIVQPVRGSCHQSGSQYYGCQSLFSSSHPATRCSSTHNLGLRTLYQELSHWKQMHSVEPSLCNWLRLHGQDCIQSHTPKQYMPQAKWAQAASLMNLPYSLTPPNEIPALQH